MQPILALQLDVNNPKTGLTACFEATYTADAAYFAIPARASKDAILRAGDCRALGLGRYVSSIQ